MIDQFLYADWDEAPEAMNFELPLGLAISHCAELVQTLRLSAAETAKQQHWDAGLELFLLVPAIINVALNYNICLQFGLPLHPTEYIDFNNTPHDLVNYTSDQKSAALELFDSSIKLARAAYRLDSGFAAQAQTFLASLPLGLESFVYTSRADKYTWRGADPEKVRALAAQVLKASRPSLAIGAAHGAIMAGLLLAEYLDCPLWFLRFSMFKRNDNKPVITASDQEKLKRAASVGDLLLFDEDSATGTTLSVLSSEVSRIVSEPGKRCFRTAAVIRHITTGFEPDHVGKVWWD